MDLGKCLDRGNVTNAFDDAYLGVVFVSGTVIWRVHDAFPLAFLVETNAFFRAKRFLIVGLVYTVKGFFGNLELLL